MSRIRPPPFQNALNRIGKELVSESVSALILWSFLVWLELLAISEKVFQLAGCEVRGVGIFVFRLCFENREAEVDEIPLMLLRVFEKPVGYVEQAPEVTPATFHWN